MKKQVKMISIMLVIAMVLVSAFNMSFAVSGALDTLGSDTTDANVLSFGQKIVPIVRTIGIIAAVVILMIVGIKYMIGSAEEKAEYKKTMPAYLIGAILVFAASQVLAFILNIANGLK